MRYHQVLVSARPGGAELLALQIHRHLLRVRPGHSALLVPHGSETERMVAGEQLEYRTYHLDWLQGRSRWRSLSANGQLVSRGYGRGDLLHIHSPFAFAGMRPFLTISPARTVLHLHLDYSEDQIRESLRTMPSLIVTCAAFIERRVRTVMAPRSHQPPVAVVRNAVDLERFTPGDRAGARRTIGLPDDRPILLMTANLAWHKGQDTAIKAVAELVRRGHRPLLLILGEDRQPGGAYGAGLRQLAHDLAVERFVQFLGFRADVPDILRAADFLLLPSQHEGLPLAVLEAQATGVVVVASPAGGVPEVIRDGETGFLIPHADAAGYADVLERLFRDPSCVAAIRDAALSGVRAESSIERYCRKIVDLYDGSAP